ncbi:helix-turn-helix transcriptional regulator, partial [bacterium]|nr:helix-turn-helix transcriptional regulator [bacterium]
PEKNAVFILNETLATLAKLEAKEALGTLTAPQQTLLTNLKIELQLTTYTEGFGYNSDISELQTLRLKIDEIHDIHVTPGLLQAIASGDELIIGIQILMNILIHGANKVARKSAGKELHQIFQSHPEFNIQPLINYMMGEASTIGRRIEILRHVNDLKQEDIERDIKIDQVLISKWETGIVEPLPPSIFKIANYFRVDPVRIYKGKILTEALKDASTIGERIDILCCSRGRLYTEVGRAIGVSEVTVQNWAHNRNKPYPAELYSLAKYFGVEPTLIY